MKTLSALLILMFAVSFSFGQEIGGLGFQNLQYEVNRRNLDYNASIEGSAYLEAEFSKGIFYTNDGHSIEMETRLNLYENGFEFKVQGENVLVYPSSIDSIVYKNSTYIYAKTDYNNSHKERVLKRISSTSSGGIYELNKVVFQEAVAAQGYTDPSPAQFKRENPVLVLLFNNKVVVLSNMSRLYEAFSDQEDELKMFVKKNKVRKNKAEKLEDLLRFMEKTVN